MRTLDEKKTALVAAYRLNEKLESQASHLKGIVDKTRAAAHDAEDYSAEYGKEDDDPSPPIVLFNRLDDIHSRVIKQAAALDKVWETAESALCDLEAEEGVICRCCGEVFCDDPERAKGAPTMTLVFDGTRKREIDGSSYNLYRATISCEGEAILAQGTNGNIFHAAKGLWLKYGFEEHGAYKYSLGLEYRLKKALAEATASA